jgi:hypothetical protein
MISQSRNGVKASANKKNKPKAAKNQVTYTLPPLAPWISDLVDCCSAYLADNTYDVSTNFSDVALKNDPFVFYCYNSAVQVEPETIKAIFAATKQALTRVKKAAAVVELLKPEVIQGELTAVSKEYIFRVGATMRYMVYYGLASRFYGSEVFDDVKKLFDLCSQPDVAPEIQEDLLTIATALGDTTLYEAAVLYLKVTPLLSAHGILPAASAQEEKDCSGCCSDETTCEQEESDVECSEVECSDAQCDAQ